MSRQMNRRAVLAGAAVLGDDAVWQDAWAAADSIVAEIERATATTLDGMRVKALAVSWCHCGEKFDEESFAGDYTIDTRIICSLLNNLLA